jgi:hypothetical protein
LHAPECTTEKLDNCSDEEEKLCSKGSWRGDSGGLPTEPPLAWPQGLIGVAALAAAGRGVTQKPGRRCAPATAGPGAVRSEASAAAAAAAAAAIGTLAWLLPARGAALLPVALALPLPLNVPCPSAMRSSTMSGGSSAAGKEAVRWGRAAQPVSAG